MTPAHMYERRYSDAELLKLLEPITEEDDLPYTQGMTPRDRQRMQDMAAEQAEDDSAEVVACATADELAAMGRLVL